jgi:multiple sugar transport system permease protein
MSADARARDSHRLLLLPVHAALLMACLITLLPFAWMICASLKTGDDLFTYRFLPLGEGFLGVAWDRLTIIHFFRALNEIGLGRSLASSFFLASSHALLATLCCALGGYALAKHQFKGRTLVTAALFFAMVVPAPLLMAPGYKLAHDLGLINTFAGLLLPGLTPAFGVFLFRQSMMNSVPTALIESARIDGAGELRIFLTIVIPLVRPMIGAHMMIAFLASWNNFISPQLILQDDRLVPLSVALSFLRGSHYHDFGLLMAGTVISVAPVMAIFLLLQREFISGLTSGAIKG